MKKKNYTLLISDEKKTITLRRNKRKGLTLKLVEGFDMNKSCLGCILNDNNSICLDYKNIRGLDGTNPNTTFCDVIEDIMGIKKDTIIFARR